MDFSKFISTPNLEIVNSLLLDQSIYSLFTNTKHLTKLCHRDYIWVAFEHNLILFLLIHKTPSIEIIVYTMEDSLCSYLE